MYTIYIRVYKHAYIHSLIKLIYTILEQNYGVFQETMNFSMLELL